MNKSLSRTYNYLIGERLEENFWYHPQKQIYYLIWQNPRGNNFFMCLNKEIADGLGYEDLDEKELLFLSVVIEALTKSES